MLFNADLVNEGLAFALRANDFHTSRQLLILYSLVAAKKRRNSEGYSLLESNGQPTKTVSGPNTCREEPQPHVSVQKQDGREGEGDRRREREVQDIR